jgi:hypothetical protein
LTRDGARGHQELVGPPSSVPEDDEQAQRFDVVVLGLELVAVDGDVALGRLRRQVEQIATALSEPTRIPAVRSTAQPLGCRLSGLGRLSVVVRHHPVTKPRTPGPCRCTAPRR